MKKQELRIKCAYRGEVEAEKVIERSFRIFADRALTKRGDNKEC